MQRDVLRDRELEHEAAPLPVLRDVPDACVEGFPRVRRGEIVPGDRDTAALDLAQPGERVDQLGLPVSVDAGDADDLAGAHAEGHAPHRF